MPFYTIKRRIGSAAVTSVNVAQAWIRNPLTNLKRLRRPHKRKALLIGINYGDKNDAGRLGELIGPHEDVRNMRDLLIDQYKYKPDNIVVMIDAAGHELQPTRANILIELRNLVADAQPGDRFVFLYSGHSAQNPCGDDSEDDGKDELIIPSDAVGPGGPNSDPLPEKIILDDELCEHLVKPLPPGSTLIAFLDTCHSATLLDLPHYRCNRISGWMSVVQRVMHQIFELYENSVRIHKKAILRRLSDSINKRKSKPESELESEPPATGSTLDPKMPFRSPDIRWALTASEKPRRKFCSGLCPPSNPAEQSHVVCFSACKDKEVSIEDPCGVSMTTAIIKCLRDNPRPPLKELVRRVSHNFSNLTKRMKDDYRAFDEEYNKYLESGGEPVPVPVFDLDKIQAPQVSSQVPLDMDSLLIL